MFKRSTPELREHATSKHRDIMHRLGDSFFAENNGFWLSVYPKDYRRLVTPTTWTTPQAAKAREYIREWFERAKVSKTRQEKWENSWKEEKEKDRESEHDENNSAREPQLKKRKHYHPEEPEIKESMVLCTVNHDRELIATIHSEDHTLWYQVTLRPLYSTPKTMASVFRRVRECATTPPLFTSVKYPGSRLSRVLAEAVGVHEDDIKGVKRGIQPLFDKVIQDENRIEVPTKTTKDYKRDHQKNRCEEPSKGREGKDTNETAEEDITRRESQETSTKNSQQQSTKQHKESTASQEQTKEKAEEQTKEKTDGQTTLPDHSEEQTAAQEQIPLTGEQTASQEQTNPSPSESIDQLPAEISLFVPAAESTLMDASQSDEKIETNKALKFLKHGVMPLLPPAKREWTGVDPIKILDGPTPLTWPPEKWETFTPDQKLFAWEMAATIIH